MKSIMIATPAYGGLTYSAYNLSVLNLQNLCKERGINVTLKHIYNESLITRARNTLCHAFMKSDYTHLLFLDADIEFDPEDILKLLEYDQPIVGGMYPKKTIRWDKITELANNKDQHDQKEFSIQDFQEAAKEYVFTPINLEDTLKMPAEFIEVEYTGTGIMLIKREVFEEMENFYPQDSYVGSNGGQVFRFFDTDNKWNQALNTNVYLSEDYWFCDRWRNMGGKIYLYTKMRCRHWGTFAYGTMSS